MMIRSFLAVLVFAVSSVVDAKAPDTSPIPDIEFKVLSPRSQDFFRTEEAPLQSGFAPVIELASFPMVFGAIGGVGLDLAWMQRLSSDWITVLPASARPYRNQDGGFCFGGSSLAATEPSLQRLTIDFQRWSLAREAFGMAEAFRYERNWGEAERWYAGVCKLYPLSPYAAVAAKRQEAVALLRLLNEAGEEQSEEPPLAAPEKLKVMPREVQR